MDGETQFLTCGCSRSARRHSSSTQSCCSLGDHSLVRFLGGKVHEAWYDISAFSSFYKTLNQALGIHFVAIGDEADKKTMQQMAAAAKGY